jgi:sugar lactone lactonase YvrE
MLEGVQGIAGSLGIVEPMSHLGSLRRLFIWSPLFLCLTALAFLGGCGGGGSAANGTGSQGTAPQVSVFTATVEVNVTTGQVTVANAQSTSKGRTIFTGTLATFNTSVLVNNAGSPGVKSTNVNIRNDSASPLGLDPNGNAYGINVLFGAFTITGGSSADSVQLSNPTGVIPSSAAGTNQPYINYPGELLPNANTPVQNWNFVVPSGVTSFSVNVTVESSNAYLAAMSGTAGSGSSAVYVRTFVGGTTVGFANGAATDARFQNPYGIAIDRAGNLYVADYENNCIRRITPSGVVNTIAGSPYVSDGFQDGTGNIAQFVSPLGVAVTPDGSTVYVADTSNHAIRRITLTGSDPANSASWSVTTIAGTGVEGGNYSSPTAGNTATLNNPTGIALDPGGNVYFDEADGGRIRKLQFMGGDPAQAANWTVLLIAGSATAVNGTTGDTDSTNGPSATFNIPRGLACDLSGNVYVADEYNCRIRVITPDGAVTTLAGGTSGSTVKQGYVDGAGASAEFNNPVGVAVDSAGTVYVADTNGQRVRQISRGGNVTTLAGNGTSGYVNGTGNIAQFNNPAGIAVGSSGTLYVGDQAASIRALEQINTKNAFAY